MGKTSRLLFGRSNKKTQPQIEVQEPTGPNGVPLTKAEKILGTTGLSLITGAQQQPSRVSHSPWEAAKLNAQRPRPNYATRRDSNESSVTTFDQFLFASYKAPHIRGPEDFVYSGQASVLVDEYDDEKDSVSRTTSSVAPSRQTLERQSHSTLKSAYNSQQSPPQAQHSFEASTNEKSWGRETRAPSNPPQPEVYVPRTTFARDEPASYQTGHTSLDRSYSRRGSASRRPSTAQQSAYSPPTQYTEAGPPYRHSNRRSVSQGDLATMYASARNSEVPSEELRPQTGVWKNHQPTSQPFWSRQMQEFNKIKEHVRRPPPGTKNWFDSFPELLEDSEPDSESDVGTYEIDRTSYSEPAELEDSGSVKAPESVDYSVYPEEEAEQQLPEPIPGSAPIPEPEPIAEAERSMPVSPLSTRQSFHSSLHDIVERPESRDPVPPIPSAFSPDTNASITDFRGTSTRHGSLVSAIVPESEYEAPTRPYHNSLPQSRASRSSASASSEADEAQLEDVTRSNSLAEEQVAPKRSRRSRDSLPTRTSLTGSVKSIRTTHSMPAFRDRDPPSSPAYLTIPPQYTRKTPTRERSASTRSRANTQGTVSNASQSSAPSSESGDSASTPAVRNKLIAVTEEEAAFLELMRRKKKALAKHEVNTTRQPSYASSVKRPKTSSGTASNPEIRQQWATVRSASVRSAKPRSTTSSALLDSFPASPTTTRWSTRSLGSAAPLSPPPTASLPSIPPVPSLPSHYSVPQPKPKTPTLYARRSLGRQTSANTRLMPSIDSSLALPPARPDTIPIPSSVPTPRLSPLTLDTIRLTRPSSGEANSAPVRTSDSSMSSTPSTPRTRQASADIIIKDMSSTRDSGSSTEEQTTNVPEIAQTLQKLETSMLIPPSSHGSNSPLSSMQSPISPLSPRWNRTSLAQSLYSKGFVPSPMYRESFSSDKSEYPEDFADAVSTQRDGSSNVSTPKQDTTPISQKTIVIPPSAERRDSSPPIPFPRLKRNDTDSGLLSPVPAHPRRKRPGGLSIDVGRANGNNDRRHSIGDTSRQSIQSLASLRASIRVSQAIPTPAFAVEEIAEQVYMRPAIQQHMQPQLQSQQRRYSGYTGRESRMSINADVMAAWGELGGWSAVARIS